MTLRGLGRQRMPRTNLIVLVLVFASTLWLPSANAAHWCESLPITINPTQAVQDERIPFSVVIANNLNASLNVTARVRFDWETQSTFWGTRTLAQGQGAANTYAKAITGAVGDHTVSVSVAGSLEGEGGPTPCSNFVFPFRVQPVPGPPQVVAKASILQASPGMAITFFAAYSGAVAPVALEWRFGDGQVANGLNVTHSFADPGTQTAQIVLTDGRGRVATDRLAITVAAADQEVAWWADLRDRPEMAVSTAALVTALAALVLSFRTRRTPWAATPATPPLDGGLEPARDTTREVTPKPPTPLPTTTPLLVGTPTGRASANGSATVEEPASQLTAETSALKPPTIPASNPPAPLAIPSGPTQEAPPREPENAAEQTPEPAGTEVAPPPESQADAAISPQDPKRDPQKTHE